MNIDKMIAELNRGGGVASPARFQVNVHFPTKLGAISQFGDASVLLAEITELPGRQIATTPQIMYGLARKMPYGVVYNDLPITFICTNSMNLRHLFDEWHSLITDPTNNFFNYYNDYVGTIDILKLDEQNNIKYRYYLDEVFPITIESQGLDYAATDQYLKLTVQFAYRRWRTDANLRTGGAGAFPSVEGNGILENGGTLQIPPPIENKLTPKRPEPSIIDEFDATGRKISS